MLLSYIITLCWIAFLYVGRFWLGPIIRQLFRIGRVSLYSSGLEANTCIELMIRHEMKTGNRFLPMKGQTDVYTFSS